MRNTINFELLPILKYIVDLFSFLRFFFFFFFFLSSSILRHPAALQQVHSQTLNIRLARSDISRFPDQIFLIFYICSWIFSPIFPQFFPILFLNLVLRMGRPPGKALKLFAVMFDSHYFCFFIKPRPYVSVFQTIDGNL